MHPCLECGACCAHYRVSFYWREEVPEHLTVDQSDFRKAMKGTAEKSPRKCIALSGQIGKRASCTIYENRPTPCRDFQASYEDGVQNKRCDEARAAHGLRPLTPGDWLIGRDAEL